MNPNAFFNVPNVVFWVILAAATLVQGYLVGEVWPEARRWRLSYVTIFGGSLILVAVNGWDGRTG